MSNPASFLHHLTGSMSEGAAGNPTGVMMEAAFAHHHLPWRYVNMEVPAANLAEAVRGARAMGFRGFNCSIPHKIAVIQHLDGLGRSAEIIGAVNCVVARDGRLLGENTDGVGFLRSLEPVLPPAGKEFVILGAGGAARAIAVELALAGARHLTIVNRNMDRGSALAHLISTRTSASASFIEWNKPFRVPNSANALINATCVGLYRPNDLPNVELDSLREGTVVADVVFNPVQTRLLKEAAARACIPLDGLGMLVNQGATAIQHWTGITPDARVLRAALETAMGV
jgi:shikimate dehydrogenase